MATRRVSVFAEKLVQSLQQANGNINQKTVTALAVTEHEFRRLRLKNQLQR
jgi:ribosomal protein L20